MKNNGNIKSNGSETQTLSPPHPQAISESKKTMPPIHWSKILLALSIIITVSLLGAQILYSAALSKERSARETQDVFIRQQRDLTLKLLENAMKDLQIIKIQQTAMARSVEQLRFVTMLIDKRVEEIEKMFSNPPTE